MTGWLGSAHVVLGTFFLSALLPPIDPDEPTFYEVLGLEPSATDEDLRRAYRKLSLKLHPDKIAQKFGGDAAKQREAAAEYEGVQEAYHVLIDATKRRNYDALGNAPTRYRFVYERKAFADPQSIYENLTSAAVADKSRLVGLFGLGVGLVLLQPILVAAKVNQTLSESGALRTASWFAVLVPYWIFGGLWIGLTLTTACFVPPRDRYPLVLTGTEQIAWYLGIIFLCFKWDGTWDESVPYRVALIPVYIAMVLRWTRSGLLLWTVRRDVNRMVTSEYIETEFLKGKSMDELSEEEQKDLADAFLVVSVDPDFVPNAEEWTVEELEEARVESSPEYLSATAEYNKTFHGLSCSLVFGIVFLVLLTLKLDDRLPDSANWWAVFSPFWIERGGRLVFNLYKCCCSSISGEEVVLYTEASVPAGGDADDDENDDDNKESANETTQPESTDTTECAKKEPSSETKESDGSKANVPLGSEEATGKEAEEGSGRIETEIEVENKATSTGDGDAEEDEDAGIHLDEDTFDAFQNAYQQAEDDAKQERRKYCTQSCVVLFQIILLVLVVAKLEASYESTDPDSVGFNVFWILFPFFVLFGCSWCCCAIIICGVAPDQAEDGTDKVETDPENPPIQNAAEPEGNDAVVPADEGPGMETAGAPVKESDEAKSEASDQSNPPSDSNMDDLD